MRVLGGYPCGNSGTGSTINLGGHVSSSRPRQRPIPTLASIPNRLSGKGFVAKESTTDIETDTIFTTP